MLLHRHGGHLIALGRILPGHVVHPGRGEPAKQRFRPGIVLLPEEPAELKVPFHHQREIIGIRRRVIHWLQQSLEHHELALHNLEPCRCS